MMIDINRMILIMSLYFTLPRIKYCQRPTLPPHLGYPYRWIEKPEMGDKFTADVFGVRYPDTPPYSDLFYDRLYGIVLDVPNHFKDDRPFTILSTGVLIDHNRVLTSHNPFRLHIKEGKNMNNIAARILLGRRNYNNTRTDLFGKSVKVKYGRPVHPVHNEEDISQQDLWHGKKNTKVNSPLHDLLIMKLDEDVPLNDTLQDLHLNRHFYSNTTDNEGKQMFQAIVTRVAKPGERIDRNSLGVAGLRIRGLYKTNSSYNLQYRFIEFFNYDITKKVIENCDEWIPRNWGHFICLRHDHISRFSSGSMLFSRNKLFGVGSFAVHKSLRGIMVFTDVRPYAELLLMTCTDAEANWKS